MDVLVNGEPRAVAGGTSIAALLALLDLGSRRVAVAINRSVVPRTRFEGTLLEDGDRVEILEAVGGG